MGSLTPREARAMYRLAVWRQNQRYGPRGVSWVERVLIAGVWLAIATWLLTIIALLVFLVYLLAQLVRAIAGA